MENNDNGNTDVQLSDEEKAEQQRLAEEAAEKARLEAEAEAAAAAAAAEEAKKKVKKVKARVLYKGQYGDINDVVMVDPAVLKADNADNGPKELDGNKAAVEYAESLQKTDKE